MDNSPTPQMLSERDACRFLGVSRSYLAVRRMAGRTDGPTYFKFGKSVRYRVEDLDTYREAHRVDFAGAV